MTNFLLVLVCAVGVASLVGSLYAFGLRNLIEGQGTVNENGERTGRHGGRMAIAYVCFALCIFIVLFALCLIVPGLHALIPGLK